MTNILEDFVPTKEYKVTVERITTLIKTDGTDYKATGKKDEQGNAEYEYVAKPPFIDTKTAVVFQQTSEKTDILALIAAVNGVEFK